MSWYTYEGFSGDKKKVSGTLWGDSEEEIQAKLEYQSITPIRIESTVVKSTQKRWKTAHMIHFAYRMHMLLGAGISLRKALDMMVHTKGSTIPYAEIREDVGRGMALSRSVAKYGCPIIVTTILEAGEASGTLVESLGMIQKLYEEEHRLRQQLVSAITYPSFLVVLMLVFIGVAVGFILPQFKSVFESMQVELPPLTAALFAGGTWLQEKGLYLLASIFLFGMGLWKAYQRESIRYSIHRYLWRKMQQKEWIMAYPMVRMCQIWQLLIKSGIPLLQLLDMTTSLWGNLWASTLQTQVKARISQGHGFTESLEQVQLGTTFLWDLLRIGEETGELERMLEQGHSYYQGMLERTMKRGEQLLEPIMLSIMGSIIAVLVVAVMLPMFNSISAIQ
jgi:type II secretion system protein